MKSLLAPCIEIQYTLFVVQKQKPCSYRPPQLDNKKDFYPVDIANGLDPDCKQMMGEAWEIFKEVVAYRIDQIIEDGVEDVEDAEVEVMRQARAVMALSFSAVVAGCVALDNAVIGDVVRRMVDGE